MPLEFSAMQLIFGSDSPNLDDMLNIFADDTEEKYTLDTEHYLINKKSFSDKFFLLHIRYGKELPYTQTVINIRIDEEELNPRSKDQIEPDLDFPDFSRHLIMSKTKLGGLYATDPLYGRI